MISQIALSTPVNRNAACHPHVTATTGTASGARIAPTLEPELKSPVAKARSRRGNHSATVLIAAGKLPASPSPSRKRAAGESQHAARERVTHRRHAPHADRQRVADARAELVDQRAGADEANRIRRLKRGDDVAVLDLAPAELLREIRREHAEHLPIDIVERRRREQQRADAPAIAPDRYRWHDTRHVRT